ncbi:MAG: FeoA family protein [Gammaproteobacteria bacterium]
MHAQPDLYPTTLRQVAPGELAVIVAVPAKDHDFHEIFSSRGLCPGAEIAVLQGGDPMCVALDQARWALSRTQAERIEVSVIRSARRGS